MSSIRHIVVATDFSDCSREAVERAVDFARTFGAKLTVVHVWQISPMVAAGTEYAITDLVGPIEDAAREQLEAEVTRLRSTIPSVAGELRNGAGWEEILDVAKQKNADLIVLGTHGRRGLTHALLGSVAERVVRMSPVPVLTVRHAQTTAQPAIAKSA